MSYTNASILDSIKKNLGMEPDYTEFDPDVIMHINSVFAVLNQLAVGPADGFAIENKDKLWSDYVPDDKRQNMVRSYVYLKVRLLFDPPTTSFAISAFEEQAKEMEWRLNIVADPWPDVPQFPEEEDDE